jgi:hypothetical protein
VQVSDELASAAERVDARLYPEPVRARIDAQARAGGWEPLIFQEPENAAHGLAAGGRTRMVDDGGRIREGVPGEGRQVTRRFLGDGDERWQGGGGLP